PCCAPTAVRALPPIVDASSTAVARAPCLAEPVAPTLRTICLSLLADHEGVQRPAPLACLVEHCGHRVDTQRRPPDRVGVPPVTKVRQDLADQRSSGVVPRQPTEVDERGRLRCGRSRAPTPDHYTVMDEFTQVVPLRHAD